MSGTAPGAAARRRPARTGIVLLNFGSPDDTFACLASLEASLDLDVEIVVVENGPAGEVSERLTAELGDRVTVLVTGDNLGYAGGNNVGIQHLLDRGCPFVWVLNPDTVVEPETLTDLHAHLAAVPDCGIVGPRLMLPGTPPTIWFDGGVVDHEIGSTRHVHLGKDPATVSAPKAVDTGYVTGASMLVRREVVEQIGKIPEQYFLYFEEVDWCVKARRAGWRVMVDRRATMTHLKRSSGLVPTPYFIYYMTRNRYLFAQDCLGLDGEIALDQLQRTFLTTWRKKVLLHAPEWVDEFDDLVRRGTHDARAGITGRNDHITSYPAAVVTPAPDTTTSRSVPDGVRRLRHLLRRVTRRP